jgi:hypothetical protein
VIPVTEVFQGADFIDSARFRIGDGKSLEFGTEDKGFWPLNVVEGTGSEVIGDQSQALGVALVEHEAEEAVEEVYNVRTELRDESEAKLGWGYVVLR